MDISLRYFFFYYSAKVTCSDTEFTCTDGKCIPRRWFCDGGYDCPDHSDETNEKCKLKDKKSSSKCSSKEFMCLEREDCIPEAWQCDGDVDCADGSDEKNCTFYLQVFIST